MTGTKRTAPSGGLSVAKTDGASSSKKNKLMKPEFKLREGEKYSAVFNPNLDSIPQWGGVPICARFHVKGFCFEDWPHGLSEGGCFLRTRTAAAGDAVNMDAIYDKVVNTWPPQPCVDAPLNDPRNGFEVKTAGRREGFKGVDDGSKLLGNGDLRDNPEEKRSLHCAQTQAQMAALGATLTQGP